MNDPCERCGLRPNTWFIDHYVCTPCKDEWEMFQIFVIGTLIR